MQKETDNQAAVATNPDLVFRDSTDFQAQGETYDKLHVRLTATFRCGLDRTAELRSHSHTTADRRNRVGSRCLLAAHDAKQRRLSSASCITNMRYTATGKLHLSLDHLSVAYGVQSGDQLTFAAIICIKRYAHTKRLG